MAATRKHCWECGASFYGRADARYCTGSCRQKAYRERTHRQAATDTLSTPALADAIAVARRTRSQARATRRRAAGARQVAIEVRAQMHHG
ncbi:hypothetical protein [Mycobacterium aquaticum]|uniref:Uncharacterized protein n=1 Tax=Mycobacterium aquaticum TaxID=1927124 RepID=A0A1X0ACR3_9MYCO|nr:hypothetical protein [Mycobacterium aquaticum]ORA27834.1 hypothetical protein BST13_29265 [Mycobacterium aquaticum]